MIAERFFLDTNVLVYAVQLGERRKHAIALEWVTQALQTGMGLLSHQVVQEWFNVVTRKSAVPMPLPKAHGIYLELIEPLWQVQSSRRIIDSAVQLCEVDSISWWDALIVAAAMEGGCQRLLSEDLQHGRVINGVEIVNPFRV